MAWAHSPAELLEYGQRGREIGPGARQEIGHVFGLAEVVRVLRNERVLDAIGAGVDCFFDVAFGRDVHEHALVALVCRLHDRLQRRARQLIGCTGFAVVDALDEIGLAFQFEDHAARALRIAGFTHQRVVLVQR